MKRIFPFFFIFSLFFSSCTNSEFKHAKNEATRTPTVDSSTSTPILDLIDSAETVLILPPEYLDQLGARTDLILSNGKEANFQLPDFVINEQMLAQVSIIPIDSKEKVNNINIQLDRAHTVYYFDSWSPDNTAFVGGFYDASLYSGGEWCCGEAIAITNIIEGKAQTSIYSWGWNYANDIEWSGDSSMLSVSFFTDKHNTLIIDKYGKLIKTLKPTEQATFWLENILYYTHKNGDDIELWRLDLQTQESSLILNDFKGIYDITQNEKLNEVFLTQTLIEAPDKKSTIKVFYILDTNAKVLKELESPAPNITSAYPWASSPTNQYVALKAVFNWGQENHLWIFNWETHEIKDYGKIKDLFGWFESHNGFLITSVDGTQKIIRP